MSVRERLKFILVKENLKQRELASILNVSSQTVNNWLKRDAISKEAAQSISEKLGYSLNWLLNGLGDEKIEKKDNQFIQSNITEDNSSGVFAWDNYTLLDDSEVEVAFLQDIDLIKNDGAIMNVDYKKHKIRLPKSTLQQVGAPLDGSTVVCFKAKGNSMTPVIPSGATIAIDTSNKTIYDGKVYVIEQDGLKRLRMLYKRPGSRLIIRSYNRDEYEDEEDNELNVKIIGRMFWYSVLHF